MGAVVVVVAIPSVAVKVEGDGDVNRVLPHGAAVAQERHHGLGFQL